MEFNQHKVNVFGYMENKPCPISVYFSEEDAQKHQSITLCSTKKKKRRREERRKEDEGELEGRWRECK